MEFGRTNPILVFLASHQALRAHDVGRERVELSLGNVFLFPLFDAFDRFLGLVAARWLEVVHPLPGSNRYGGRSRQNRLKIRSITWYMRYVYSRQAAFACGAELENHISKGFNDTSPKLAPSPWSRYMAVKNCRTLTVVTKRRPSTCQRQHLVETEIPVTLCLSSKLEETDAHKYLIREKPATAVQLNQLAGSGRTDESVYETLGARSLTVTSGATWRLAGRVTSALCRFSAALARLSFLCSSFVIAEACNNDGIRGRVRNTSFGLLANGRAPCRPLRAVG